MQILQKYSKKCQIFVVLRIRPQGQRPKSKAFKWQLMVYSFKNFSIYDHIRYILHTSDTNVSTKVTVWMQYNMYVLCIQYFMYCSELLGIGFTSQKYWRKLITTWKTSFCIYKSSLTFIKKKFQIRLIYSLGWLTVF